ncbi:uncharacterized protein [Solanum lycopersicum]|uniref:uncharacterized protein n=1 Tax=Solanum lycopersicum TaxID=4081 RepID=UPI00374956AA
MLPNAPGEHQQRGQNPVPRPQAYYRGYVNIADSDGPLVLAPLPRGDTFVNHNNKAVLDTIAGGSYEECPYAEITEKLEKISRNNNSWSTRKSDTGRNTFAVQSTHNLATDEIREEMAQIRTKLGFVLKHVIEGAEKINAVNYLAKPPLPNVECYYTEDTYAVNEQTVELQVAQLSATVNTRQPVTLSCNIIQNPKNDAHYMAITNLGGRQTINPPIPSTEENVRKDNDNVVKGSFESEESNGKDAEVPIKVIRMPRSPPHFPQILVKKTEDDKYRRFITMLRHLSINVPLVEALEQMPSYAKFMNDVVTNKRSVTFEDDDRLQHCSAIATRSLHKLMPLSIYKKLGLGDQKHTAMRLLMANRTMKRPIAILHDVLVKVESFIFPADFVILDCEVDFKVTIILGKPFLATG